MEDFINETVPSLISLDDIDTTVRCLGCNDSRVLIYGLCIECTRILEGIEV